MKTVLKALPDLFLAISQELFQFPAVNRRRVETNFQGGDITSNGGVLLLQQVDGRLGLTQALARAL